MQIIRLLGACALLFECVTAHAGLGKWSQDAIPYNGFDTRFNAIAIDQRGRVYAGTDFGAYASSDGGLTWMKILDKGANAVSVQGNGLYVGSGCNILSSFDGGATWSSSSKLGSSPYCSVFAIAFDSRDGMYAMAQSVGLYKSPDRGSSWVNVGAGSGLVNTNFAAIAIDRFDNIYVGVNQAYPYNGVAIPGGVFKSADGGSSWTRTTIGIDDIQFVTSVTSDFDGNIYAATSPGGLLKGVGGTSWSDANTGFPSASAPYFLSIDSSGILYVGTRSGNGVYKSSNGGHNWAAVDTAGWSSLSIASAGLASPGNINALVIDANGTVYAGGAFMNSTHSMTTTPFLVQYTPVTPPSGTIPTSSTGDSDRIFNYLESIYPQYLAPTKAVSTTISGYYCRYYSTTKSYIATSNGELYYLGPASGNAVLDLGKVADMLATASKAGF